MARSTPYAIAREDGEILALAGLWEGWKSPDGETVRTFAIITTDADTEMAALHDRMPVIREQEDRPLWFGEVEGDPAALLHPAPDHTLRAWPVSRAVNMPRNHGPELLEPAAEVPL
jgi:putative SOS response-associated peptidase YedK